LTVQIPSSILVKEMILQSLAKKKHPAGFSFLQYGDRFSLCGQPSKKDLEEFRKENWDLILNLRNPEELDSLDFQMDEVCHHLGLKYLSLPIMFQGDIRKSALKDIHQTLSSDSYKKIVIHCASGKRAILALLAHLFLSQQCELEDIPKVAERLQFNSPPLLNRLCELLQTL